MLLKMKQSSNWNSWINLVDTGNLIHSSSFWVSKWHQKLLYIHTHAVWINDVFIKSADISIFVDDENDLLVRAWIYICLNLSTTVHSHTFFWFCECRLLDNFQLSSYIDDSMLAHCEFLFFAKMPIEIRPQYLLTSLTQCDLFFWCKLLL